MNTKNNLFVLIVFIIIAFFPFKIWATSVAGFLPNQIWYSPESFGEGETVKIYTAIWNGEENSFSAKVEFYDKNVVLGSRNVVVAPGKVEVVSISWKVTSGDHLISAKIISPTLLNKSGDKEVVSLQNNVTKADKKFIPVKIKKEDEKSTETDQSLKEGINKVSDKIEDLLPENVNQKVSSGILFTENFRSQTLEKITGSQEKTEELILELEKRPVENSSNLSLEEATQKPIAQIKLFFLKVLNMIFSHKILFYGLILFFFLSFIRWIYRRIRRR
jgi:hypothetical protein